AGRKIEVVVDRADEHEQIDTYHDRRPKRRLLEQCSAAAEPYAHAEPTHERYRGPVVLASARYVDEADGGGNRPEQQYQRGGDEECRDDCKQAHGAPSEERRTPRLSRAMAGPPQRAYGSLCTSCATAQDA